MKNCFAFKKFLITKYLVFQKFSPQIKIFCLPKIFTQTKNIFYTKKFGQGPNIISTKKVRGSGANGKKILNPIIGLDFTPCTEQLKQIKNSTMPVLNCLKEAYSRTILLYLLLCFLFINLWNISRICQRIKSQEPQLDFAKITLT